MDKERLQHIISMGENEQAEFKTSFNREVIESLVAFANKRGGSVYIGISKTNRIVGVDINSESVQSWINEIKSKTSPALIADSDMILIDSHKAVVRLSVAEYPIKPVSTQGKYYKRAFNSNHLLSTDEIANEHLKTINTSWDYYPSPYHSLDDISLEKVKSFIAGIERKNDRKISIDTLEFLKKFELVREGRPTLGAYLLFAKDHCAISDIQVGRFKSDITIIDSISLQTDLFAEVEQVLAFIRKHLMVEYIITGKARRTERFDYPLDAIREIVVNMIVHRDYRSSSASIIKFFDKRIEFFNPGGLYDGLTLSDLLSGDYTSKTRNKLIAKAFKEFGLVERYGTGVKRILDICSSHGVFPPKFEERPGGFLVTLFKEKINNVPWNGLLAQANEPSSYPYGTVKGHNDPTNDHNDPINDPNDTTNDHNDPINDPNDTINYHNDPINGPNDTINYHNDPINGPNDTINYHDDPLNDPNDPSNDHNDPLNDPINANNDPTNAPNDHLKDRMKKILNLIRENQHITREEIARACGVSLETIKRDFRKMQAANLLKRRGSKKTGYWELAE